MDAAALIDQLEKLIQHDEGCRGIGDLVVQGELLNGANALMSANNVAIITGFPCLIGSTPPTETDGPLGAICIARSLIALGKSVSILTDECNEAVVLATATGAGISGTVLTMESFPGGSSFDENDDERLRRIACSIDAVVAIERAGPCHDGSYRTMKGLDMSDSIAPLDRLLDPVYVETSYELFGMNDEFESDELVERDEFTREVNVIPSLTLSPAPCSSGIDSGKKRVVSIAIGDGGNEVGMGKVLSSIVNSKIENAAAIACTVSSDHLIVSSVSNWGGYALAGALGVLAAESTCTFCSDVFLQPRLAELSALLICPTPSLDDMALMSQEEVEQHIAFSSIPLVQRRRIYAASICLPTDEEEIALCGNIVDAGARDGISGKQEISVDGMSFEKSLEILRNVKCIMIGEVAKEDDRRGEAASRSTTTVTIAAPMSPQPDWVPGQSQPSPYEHSPFVAIDPKEEKGVYPLCISGITPRPVAFISSVSTTGVCNLAPFSYFGLMSHDPPTLSIGIVMNGKHKKDTLVNIEETGEFVCNIISEWMVEGASHTAGAFSPDIDEFVESGLTKLPSVLIKPARCKESAFQMECKMTSKQELINDEGVHTTTIITARVVMFHVAEPILGLTERGSKFVKYDAFRSMGRLGGNTWSTLGDKFDIARPAV